MTTKRSDAIDLVRGPLNIIDIVPSSLSFLVVAMERKEEKVVICGGMACGKHTLRRPYVCIMHPSLFLNLDMLSGNT